MSVSEAVFCFSELFHIFTIVMFIRKLNIVNYKSIGSFEYDSDRLMNIFVGDNGAGKSSILQAVKILFSWFSARMRNPKGNGEVVAYEDIRKGADYCFLSIEIVVSGRSVSWQLYRQRSTFRGQPIYKTNLADMTEFASSLVGGGLGHVPCWPMMSFYGVSRSISDPPLRIRKRHKLEALDLYDKASLESGANFNSFFCWFREKEDIENQTRLDGNDAFRDGQLECIRHAVESVFSGFSGFRVNRKNKSFEISKDGEVFRFSQLSDGEKCYLGLVMDMARALAVCSSDSDPLRSENVVLIDELDLHLHPTWQVGVLERLRRTFPGCQFFISTHSPYILSEVNTETDNLFSISNGVVSCLESNPFGKTVGDILLHDFGQRTLRNPYVTKLIQSAWNIVKGKKVEGKTFDGIMDELRRIIPGDIELVKLEHSYRRDGINNAER